MQSELWQSRASDAQIEMRYPSWTTGASSPSDVLTSVPPQKAGNRGPRSWHVGTCWERLHSSILSKCRGEAVLGCWTVGQVVANKATPTLALARPWQCPLNKRLTGQLSGQGRYFPLRFIHYTQYTTSVCTLVRVCTLQSDGFFLLTKTRSAPGLCPTGTAAHR